MLTIFHISKKSVPTDRQALSSQDASKTVTKAMTAQIFRACKGAWRVLGGWAGPLGVMGRPQIGLE